MNTTVLNSRTSGDIEESSAKISWKKRNMTTARKNYLLRSNIIIQHSQLKLRSTDGFKKQFNLSGNGTLERTPLHMAFRKMYDEAMESSAL